jgi:hypothetical protein
MRRSARSIAAAVLAAAAWTGTCAGAEPERVLGVKPAYTDRAPSAVPNAAAMSKRIWAPGLDHGFVPQGVTFADGALLVAAYQHPKQNRGPCRVYRLDAGSGEITGTLDLPPQCGHAGGVARGRPGQLWVADTHMIFEVGLDRRGGGELGRVVRSIKLAGKLTGSFAAGTADALWLGTYSKEPGARLYKVPVAKLARGVASLSERDAAESVALPAKAQGAAFDAAGRLWITRSGSTFGELLQLNPRTGAVLQRFGMPAGIEDVSFDPKGGLWAVSEAGSKRWLGWTTYFPLIFRLQPALLR